MLPLPPKSPSSFDPCVRPSAYPLALGMRADRGPVWPCLVRSGFLGFGVLALAILVIPKVLSTGGHLHRGWWLFYPTWYVVSSLTYGWLRWITGGGGRRVRATTSRPRQWTRRGLVALAALPLAGVILVLAGVGGYTGCGGYDPARYEFSVVDPDGQPIPGVALRVLGPSREVSAYVWNDTEEPEGPRARLEGFWPVLEYSGDPLKTDAAGQLVVHQAEFTIHFSSSGVSIFGMHFETHSHGPRHAIELRHANFRPHVIQFMTLQEMALRTGAAHTRGPGGIWMRTVAVRVVMERP